MDFVLVSADTHLALVHEAFRGGFSKGEDIGVKQGQGGRERTASSTVIGGAESLQSISQQDVDNHHKGDVALKFVNPTAPKATCFFSSKNRNCGHFLSVISV